jgi:hypothetical protein
VCLLREAKMRHMQQAELAAHAARQQSVAMAASA